MDIERIRYLNLQRLIEDAGGLNNGGLSRVAEKLGKSQGQLSHIGGANPIKNIGSRLARQIELAYGFERGWMDSVHSTSVRESAPVAYLPSQSAGRPDPIVRASRATAEKLAARLGIDRSSEEFLDILDAIRDSMQQAFEEAIPDNRVDLAVRLSPKLTEETRNADGREDRGDGDHAGEADRGAARKPAGGRGKRK